MSHSFREKCVTIIHAVSLEYLKKASVKDVKETIYLVKSLLRLCT